MEIKKQDLKDKVVLFYGEIGNSSVESAVRDIYKICITDDIYRQEVSKWASENGLTVKNISVDPIQFHLCTAGGSCYDGLALYDTIASSSTPVEIICEGKIMSMGVVVTLAAKVRKAYPNTTFMIHQAAGLLFGNVQEMEESLEEIRHINDILFGIITSKTSIQKETLDELIEHKRDWYLTAQQALELGVITEII